MRIALVLIAKNEGEVLRRCLESFEGGVDRIILADSGSTDDTIAIAEEFGAEIRHYIEEEGRPFNYARARNFAHAGLEGEVDAIFSVDPDEYLHTPCREDFRKNVKKYLTMTVATEAGTDPDDRPIIDAIQIPIRSRTNDDGELPSQTHLLVRLYRPGLEFVGRVHELIIWKHRIDAQDIILIHDKLPKKLTVEQHAAKTANYLECLRLDIEENPENPRFYFYRAQTLLDSMQVDDAIEAFYVYLEIALWHEERCQAWIGLGKCLHHLARYPEAEKAFIRAAIEDGSRAEPWCYLGDNAGSAGKWASAAAYYEIATSYEGNLSNTILFLEEDAYGFHPWFHLTVAYDRMGNHEMGVEAANRALSFRPNDPASLHNLEEHQKAKTITAIPSEPISGIPVNIVIPTASLEYAEQCVASIVKAKTSIPYMVTLVVNPEILGAYKDLRQPFMRIVVAPDPFNFSEAIMRGSIGFADFVWLNDDTNVEDGWLDELQRVAYHDGTAVVSPLIDGVVGNKRQHIISKEPGVFYKTEIDALMFVAVYVPRRVVEAVGILDDSFGGYGHEDNDYCYRLRNIGVPLRIAHGVTVRHIGHATFGMAAVKGEEGQQAFAALQEKWAGKTIRRLPQETVLRRDVDGPTMGPNCVMNDFDGRGTIDVGEDVEMKGEVHIEVLGGEVTLEDGVVLGTGVFIQGNGGVFIGAGTLVGPGVKIYSSFHPVDTPGKPAEIPLETASTFIGRNCVIGANVVILHNVIIGDDCHIGAGSVVTKDVPDGHVAMGSPAVVTRARNIPRERQSGNHIETSHVERYRFASKYIEDSDVALDVGCGSGYGTLLMSQAAVCRVIGIDISVVAAAQAERRGGSRTSFMVADVMRAGFPELFNVIVCLEVLEHVEQPEVLIERLRQALRPGGVLIASVPSDNVSVDKNPFHLRHYSTEDMKALLGGPGTEYFGQMRGQAVEVLTDGEKPDFFVAVLKGVGGWTPFTIASHSSVATKPLWGFAPPALAMRSR